MCVCVYCATFSCLPREHDNKKWKAFNISLPGPGQLYWAWLESVVQTIQKGEKEKKSLVIYTVLSINCAVTALCVCWLMDVPLIFFSVLPSTTQYVHIFASNSHADIFNCVACRRHRSEPSGCCLLSWRFDPIWSLTSRERFGMDGWNSCKMRTWRSVWARAQANAKEWNHFYQNKSIFHYHMKFDDLKHWRGY